MNAALYGNIHHDMLGTDNSAFLWSDAWLFLAYGLAAADGPVPILSVLPLADGIQHAVPTKEEVNGALGRLTRAGYLHIENGTVAITSRGQELLGRAQRAGNGLLAQQKALEHLLPAAPWTAQHDPRAAGGLEPEVVSSEDWTRAIAGYRS